tara:strand:- start:14869 stop:15966 length:1098 start_codon:yes stop_codon:yes gene_type:complete
MRKYTFDQPLLLSLFFLLGVGIVQVYSASYIYAIENLGDGLYFFKKQVIFALISILVFFVVWKTPWKVFSKGILLIWLATTVLIAMTLYSPFALSVNGAYRWLDLGAFRFQPAELLKVFIPILWAKYFLDLKWGETNKWHFIARAALLIAPFMLLLLQPDFGTFVICNIIVFGILFSFGLSWRYVFGLALAASGIFISLIMISPYRKARLMAFLDPWSDASGSGFQVIQSMMSFYSGGFTGVGLGQGQGKLFFLPEAHTDFTLAVLAEETGFVGVAIIIFLFTYVIFRSMQIVIQTKDTFQRCVATGLTIGFAIQVFINMGVSMGLLPTKGVTLPFISYGGSSLITTAILFGLLFNIRSQQKKKA